MNSIKVHLQYSQKLKLRRRDQIKEEEEKV